MRHSRSSTVIAALVLTAAARVAVAGFAGTDLFLPMAGRQVGVYPSNWYTTVWIHNPGNDTAIARIYFLERGTANPSPPSVDVTVAPGDTEKIDNVVESLFHLSTFGALRVTCSSQKLVVTSRVFSKAAGAGEEASLGQDFAGVPASFSIGTGEKAQVLGVHQTAPSADSEFRFNYGFVETTGHSATVRIRVLDGLGAELASEDLQVREFSQRQVAFKDHFPSLSLDNARLEFEVVSGSGRIIAYGSSIANASQDPTTFEMTYPDSLLGIANVQHDSTLTGDGTAAAPLGVADGGIGADQLPAQIVTSEKLADAAVTVHKIATSSPPPPPAPGVSAMRADPLEAFFKVGDTMFWDLAFTGDITAVTTAPGSGLTGGVTSGDADLAITPAGVTSSMLADRSVTLQKLDMDPPWDEWSTTLKRNSQGMLYWAVDSFMLPVTVHVGIPFSPVSPHVFQITNDLGITSIEGVADSGTGVKGRAQSGTGVEGSSDLSNGVNGISQSSNGVEGATSAGSLSRAGVHGTALGAAAGVLGQSVSGIGVIGQSTSGIGVRGTSTSGSPAVQGQTSGLGVAGEFSVSDGRSTASSLLSWTQGVGAAVEGRSNNSTYVGYLGRNGSAVYGNGPGHYGSLGTGSYGVYGVRVSGASGYAGYFDGPVRMESNSSDSLYVGNTGSGRGAHVLSASDTGLWVETSGSAFAALDARRASNADRAGYFKGGVTVTGALSKASGSFTIDHPLDPENETLSHSFVESPDMMNIYNGNVVTDENGLATVTLPDWFEALNRDFRYQLTVIGRFAQAIVEQEIADNRFTIRTNLAMVKVSWQVTGIRKDPWANAHRVLVEEPKPAEERGTYLHPEAWGQPPQKGVEAVRDRRRAEAASEDAAPHAR